MLAAPAVGRFYNLDSGSTRDGVTLPGTLRREGLAIEGRKRNGEWIVDHQSRKLSQRVWPKIQGGPVSLKLGASETVNGGIMWGATQEFNPADGGVLRSAGGEWAGDGNRVQLRENGYRLDGYKYDVTNLGEF